MEDFDIREFVNIIDNISVICQNIKNCDNLKQIFKSNSKLLLRFKEELEVDDDQESINILKTDLSKFVLVYIIRDVDKLLKEIPEFIKLSESGLKFDNPKCPTLMEVWHGDAYGTLYIEGLQSLYNELTEKYSVIFDQDMFIHRFTEYLENDMKL